MKTRYIIPLTLVLTFLLAGGAWAIDATKDLTINASINPKATLTISPSTINFNDTGIDPPNPISATEGPVTFTCKVRTGSSDLATLKVLANGDLSNGTPADDIAISNVTWTSSSSGFAASGTMNKTVAQNVASWTGSGNRDGTCTFSLANSWDYDTGNFTATATYTLTAP